MAGVCLLAQPGWCQTTIRVPADAATIQDAIDMAADGDTVLVAAGTYVEKLDFKGKAITVVSEDGPSVTFVDGGGTGPVVSFTSGEGRDSVLSGFTIQNGQGVFGGGGVDISGSSPTIRGNIITNNRGCDGIGIYSSFGSPLIEDNLITGGARSGCTGGIGGGGIAIGGNSAAEIIDNVVSNNTISGGNGGGITLFASGPALIRGNTINGNGVGGVSPAAAGGGIWIVNDSPALIVQNVITGNSAGQGGGIYWLVPSGGAGPRLANNTIADNDAPNGSGIFADGFDAQVAITNNIIVALPNQSAVHCGDFNDPNSPVFAFNDVFAPSGAAYAGICADQTGNNGNISEDPKFVDAANQDFHLQPDSPAVDAGENSVLGLPETDLDDEPRILDGDADCTETVDLGADEFGVPGVSLAPLKLSFADRPLTTTSPAETATLANSSGLALALCEIAVTGDFAQTNDCGAGPAASSDCDINVSFAPTKIGARAGTLTVRSNGAAGPLSASLEGVGADFGIELNPGSITVRPGQAASYTVTVTPQGGAFSSGVALSCSIPSGLTLATCVVNPLSVTPGAITASATLTVSTTAPSASLVPPMGSQPPAPVYALWLGGPVLAVAGLAGFRACPRRRKRGAFLLVSLLLLAGLLIACNGGSDVPAQPGTAAGNFTITIAGTSAGLQHSAAATLTVQ